MVVEGLCKVLGFGKTVGPSTKDFGKVPEPSISNFMKFVYFPCKCTDTVSESLSLCR